MITVTITIARGGQGEPQRATSASHSFAMSGLSKQEEHEIITKQMEKIGREVAEAHMFGHLGQS